MEVRIFIHAFADHFYPPSISLSRFLLAMDPDHVFAFVSQPNSRERNFRLLVISGVACSHSFIY
jgi:hypothetical protein